MTFPFDDQRPAWQMLPAVVYAAAVMGVWVLPDGAVGVWVAYLLELVKVSAVCTLFGLWYPNVWVLAGLTAVWAGVALVGWPVG